MNYEVEKDDFSQATINIVKDLTTKRRRRTLLPSDQNSRTGKRDKEFEIVSKNLQKVRSGNCFWELISKFFHLQQTFLKKI